MLPFRQKSRYSLLQITEKLYYFWYLIQAMCLSTIRIASVTLLLFFTFCLAQAKEYGNYDLKRMVTFSETPSGKQAGIDLNYLDQILNDLGLHATNYPPQFDTPQDRQRAIQDVKTLSGMLDILLNDPSPNAEILLRAGFINSLGYNLDIPGSGEKTSAIFERLLEAAPSNPRANYMYGRFLAGAKKPKEAIPYLEKALEAGVGDAVYALGMTHLSLGDKQKALKNLEDYRKRRPNDENTAKIIDAIRNGTGEFKTN